MFWVSRGGWKVQAILVVEDDHQIRVNLRHFLESEGYFVFSAANGADGLATLSRIKPPSLILLDFEMPLMNGEAFLKAKNSDPTLAAIPVVIVSGQARPGLSGVSAFVQKPFNLENLLSTVRRYCSPV